MIILKSLIKIFHCPDDRIYRDSGDLPYNPFCGYIAERKLMKDPHCPLLYVIIHFKVEDEKRYLTHEKSVAQDISRSCLKYLRFVFSKTADERRRK